MNRTRTLTLLLCSLLLSTSAAFAQSEEDAADSTQNAETRRHHGMDMKMHGEIVPTPTRRWYLGNSFDGAIFSTAFFERPGQNQELTPLRFSMLNFGYHFNYDFDQYFGIFTGLGLKNIGFIEKIGDSTTKRRLYTLGVPLGFKLGNLQKHHYGFIGGGVDMPFNYREKRFVKRNDKAKFNEFFSDRTDRFMPYLFAGFAYGAGMTFKVQYYPSNFFNTEYEEHPNEGTVRPYRGWNANLLYVTLGIDVHYKKHEKKKDMPEEAPEEME